MQSWRRADESNAHPEYIEAPRLSRPLADHSAVLSKTGGESEIRTRDRSSDSALAVRRLQPLGHLTGAARQIRTDTQQGLSLFPLPLG